MDDEFRIPLERRLATLRGHREMLQDQLRDLHHELNSIDRRLETAEEMYRREFGVDPPAATEPTTARRETRIRRRDAGQPSWREAIIGTLRGAGQPLHAKEIWRRMSESGFQSDARDPLRSVVATAIRTDEIHRAGPNTFALDGAKGAQLSVAAPEGEEQG
jgi:hypothetical protein